MEGGSVLGRASAARRRLSAPRALKTSNVGHAGVTLRWKAPNGAKPAYYVVLRDGKSLGKTTRTSFTDSKVKPGRTYRYSVRGYDSAKRAGAPSSSVRVKVPKAPARPLPAPTTNPVEPIATVAPTPAPLAAVLTPTPTPTATPTPTPTPTPDPTPDPNNLSEEMVDRLFWRAGFGPTQAQRDAWIGRSQAELVEWFLNTPNTLDLLMPAPKRRSDGGQPIDPLAAEEELELDWIDHMQRAVNPLPQRLALFWHRHWAITLADGSVSDKWAHAYRQHLVRFSDFAASPTLTFRQLAYEMTTANAAMSSFLNLNANTRTRPNENYAREFMELFCLGPTHPVTGVPNYDQADIEGLTRAFTGWRLNATEFLPDGTTPNPAYGTIAFAPSQFFTDPKAILDRTIPGVTGQPSNPAWGPSAVNQATDIVLEREVHPQFLIRKLWSEFVAAPIPQATLDSLIAAYVGSSPKYQLRPVIRGILMSPLIFESLTEPNLVKPPLIFMVGVLRALGAPIRHTTTGSLSLQVAMNDMQQRIYRPPNVAGWEGGMSWFNTNTVQGRYNMITRAQYLRYSNYYWGTARPADDFPNETAEAVVTRAHVSVNRPWISQATREALDAWSRSRNPTNAAGRLQRFYALQAMILGGPDGQVM